MKRNLKEGSGEAGKSFGARKALVVRAIKTGYRPRCATVSLRSVDISRLRTYAKAHGRSLVSAFGEVLDAVGCPSVREKIPGYAKLTPYEKIAAVILRSDATPGTALARLKRGDWDDFIKRETSLN